MPAVKRLLKAAWRPMIRRQARRQLVQLHGASHPAASRVAEALDELLSNKFSADERRWVEHIESLRDRLSRSTEPLSITDFGAGAPTDQRTAEQMLAGVEKETTVGKACANSKSRFWSLLLFKLVRKLQPETAIELGTCVGISAAYQAAAQKLNGNGRTVSLEGAAALASLSQANLQSLGLDNATVVTGRFVDTLLPTLEAHAPIDYAFIDGHHDEHATIAYYEQFRPFLTDPAVLIFDDIAWSPGMRRAWQKIQNDPDVALSISLHNVGICIVGRTASDEKRRFEFRLPA